MIVHCLPEEPPYLAVKEKFSGFYLPGDIPNYHKYRYYYGQWYLDYAFLTNYLVRIEKAYYQRLHISFPDYYYNNPVGNNPLQGHQSESSSSSSLGGNQAENREQQQDDSSLMEISNPNHLQLRLLSKSHLMRRKRGTLYKRSKMAGGNTSGNDGNDLSEVMRQLAVVAQQLARNVDAQGELFNKVAQSKPPTYQGEPYHTILENWLREFEKLFEAVGCLENSKVGCATYYLRGEADLWWQQNERTIRALPGFNWTRFQENVRDKFYPSFLHKQKAEEFSNLRMEEMSVTKSISTEKAKSRKFESGLTNDLQLKLCGQVFETLDEVYGRVAHLYALELKKKKELTDVEVKEKRKEVGMNSGNQQGNQNNFKKQKYHHNNNNFHNNNNNNSQGNNCQRGRNFNGGARNNDQGNNRNERRYFCKRCKNNHPGRDCDGNLVFVVLVTRGTQRNFQGNNNNFNGSKGAQQNGEKNNNNSNNGNNQQKSGVAGQLNVLSRHEIDSTKDVITGTFSIHSIPVKVLFVSGATFSFISKRIVSKLKDSLKTVEVVDLPITIQRVG
ncbi:uncharacterized protein LOC110702343 [Chenopodium quinoa]|uniref:uncharacterized protein LOC110702343 n=1 Tax=Chenopodium quinoa TaxID=63459 RepID=UPI000B76E301|nr:uncharacterized protein LOC110702343 [Chenopodium quinoa]